MAGVYVCLHVRAGLYSFTIDISDRFSFRVGSLMSWQEPLVLFVVGLAVTFLFRHIRALISGTNTNRKSSCHGCDDCESPDDSLVPATEHSKRSTL